MQDKAVGICDIFNPPDIAKQFDKKEFESKVNRLGQTFLKNPTERNFYVLCGTMNAGIISYVRGIINDDYAIGDILSRTMEAVYFKRDTYNSTKGKFTTWVYRIARNFTYLYIQDRLSDGTPCRDAYYRAILKMDSSYGDEQNTDASSFLLHYDECSAEELEYSDEYNGIAVGGKVIGGDASYIEERIKDSSVRCISRLSNSERDAIKNIWFDNGTIRKVSRVMGISIYKANDLVKGSIVRLRRAIEKDDPEMYKLYLENKNLPWD